MNRPLPIWPFLILMTGLSPVLAQPSVFSDNSSRDIDFQHITTAEGLSNDQTLAAVQDHQGFIWIAADDGLNRYDGYSFEIFRHEPGNPGSIPQGRVEAIFVDHAGTLWVATWAGGISRFNPDTNTFTYYPLDFANSATVNVITEDRQGQLYTQWRIKPVQSGDRCIDEVRGRPRESDPAEFKPGMVDV